MTTTLIVPGRFRGPARSGNGGYVAGALAGLLGDTAGRAVRVRLQQPPPLDASMLVSAPQGGVELSFGGAPVAAAAFTDLDFEPVEGVSFEEATRASAAYPGHTFHPFPTCFSCGVGREDGLRIFPGPVADAAGGGTRVAAPWVPDDSVAEDRHEYDDSQRRASLAVTWSALDCVGGWAGDLTERLMVLGQMTAIVDELPVIGDPHVVSGQALGSQGRKTFTASTLHDGDGRIVGRAQHVWLAVDPARFNG